MLMVGFAIGVIFVVPIILACTFHAMLSISLKMRAREEKNQLL